MKTFKNWQGNLSKYLKPKDQIDEKLYYYNLEVLPPIYINKGNYGFFQVSEPYNHTKQGLPTYSTFINKNNKFYFLGIMTTQTAKSEYVKELINKL